MLRMQYYAFSTLLYMFFSPSWTSVLRFRKYIQLSELTSAHTMQLISLRGSHNSKAEELLSRGRSISRLDSVPLRRGPQFRSMYAHSNYKSSCEKKI